MPETLSNDPHGDLRDAARDHLIRYGGDFFPFIVERASGSYLYDTDGRAILDFASGQMCASLGHNHPAMVAAIQKSCREVIHLYSNMLAPAVIELGRALTALLPPSLQKAMFPSTGGESNEAALRLAKLKTGGFEVVGLTGSWHGMSAGASSVTYASGRKKHGPSAAGSMAIPAPHCYRCPIRHCRDKCDMTCLEVGFEMTDRQSVGEYAAFIAEPVQGAGGICVPPEGYFRKAKEMCEERGMLLILDEAQTSLGRVGTNFAFERFGVVPDILTLSKTLGAGMPLSATVTSAEIEEECYEEGYTYYTSHLSDPLAAEVGRAVLAVILTEKLVEKANDLGEHLRAGLRELQTRHEAIGDVRGLGMLNGVEFVSDREKRTPCPDFVKYLCKRSLELGLNLIPAKAPGLSAIRLAPPLTATKEEIDSGLAILDQALGEAAAATLRPGRV